MKKLVFFTSLLLTLIVVMGSCSKDDSPASGNETALLQVVFNGVNVDALTSVTRPEQTKQLVDVLTPTNKDKVKYVKSGEISNSDSYITIQGLKAGESLNNLTINLMNGQNKAASLDLGKINGKEDGSLIKDDFNNTTNFLKTVVGDLATKKSITLQVVLTGGSVDVKNLTITVHSSARYSW